jgi:hypothetical protein
MPQVGADLAHLVTAVIERVAATALDSHATADRLL